MTASINVPENQSPEEFAGLALEYLIRCNSLILCIKYTAVGALANHIVSKEHQI